MKTALITGGSRGIGLGIARQLASSGFAIAINGVRPESEVQETILDLEKTAPKVVYIQGSIANSDDRKFILNQFKLKFDRLDILVNNAGIAPKVRADFLEMTEESYDHVMDTNLRGPVFLTQAFANWMVTVKRQFEDYNPMIINVSSISATVASIARGEYCISKAGISMMTQLFAVKLAEYGIPVFEVRPGIIESDMTSKVKEKYDKLLSDGLALQPRWGTPADVGKAVSAIANGAFPYSTGQVFMVDGGMLVDRL